MKHVHRLALALATLCAAPFAHAAESYDNCTGFVDSLPATISTQGVWCLRKDLTTGIGAGEAITIATNNVTLDCNGFKVGGLAAGSGTNAIGVGAPWGPLAVTVRGCNIRGFRRGIAIASAGALIEDNRLEGNTIGGIWLAGEGATVQRNLVLATGGSTAEQGMAYGIYTYDTVHVLDNTIDTVWSVQDGAGKQLAYGIWSYGNGGGSIRGNRVSQLAYYGGSGIGIYTDESLLSIVDNHIAAVGPGTIGIRCSSWNNAPAVRNVILGFVTPISGCYDAGNTVPPPPTSDAVRQAPLLGPAGRQRLPK